MVPLFSFQWLTIPLWQWCVGLFLLLTATWYVSYHIKNAGIVDVVWGFIFPVLLWLEVFATLDETGQGLSSSGWLVAGLLTVAQGRLGLYLLQRFLHEHPKEDGRYLKCRIAWTEAYGTTKAEWLMWGLFLMQGGLILAITLPLWWASKNPADSVSLLGWVALAVGVLGMTLETLADAQLSAFKKTAAPHSICQVGLWRYSRHPNFLGQWLLWVAYGLLATSYGNGWVFLYTPLLMGYFLVFMTGFRITEEHMVATRGQAYREYQRLTAPFIPGLRWPR